ARLYALAADDDLRVRYQLAFTLGELPSGPERNAALARLARRDAGDRWVKGALLTSLAQGADEGLAALADDVKLRAGGGGRAFLGQVALQIGNRARQSEVAAAVRVLETLPPKEKAISELLVRTLGQGLARSGSPLRKHLLTASGRANELHI